MFYTSAKSKVSGANELVAQAREARAAAVGRARDATSAAAQTAAQRATQGMQTAQNVAQSATQTAQAAAQTAAEAASKSVRNGVFSARGWVAPRLESAADYTAGTVALKASSVLRGTARQISPLDGRKMGSRSTLRWSLLATAAFAAAGAAVLLVRQRYRAAMAADSEAMEGPAQPMSAPGAEPMAPGGSTPADGPTDAGVNGRVSATG